MFHISWFLHKKEGVQHSSAILRKSCPSVLSVIVLPCAGVRGSWQKRIPLVSSCLTTLAKCILKRPDSISGREPIFVVLWNLFNIPIGSLMCWELSWFVCWPASGCKYLGWEHLIVVLPRNCMFILLKVRDLNKLIILRNKLFYITPLSLFVLWTWMTAWAWFAVHGSQQMLLHLCKHC